MKSNSIIFKIWLGICSIIVGYAISMVTFSLSTDMVLAELINTADARFPASRISQGLLNGFQNLVKQYNDAVLLGDTSKIEDARKASQQCLMDMADIIRLLDPGHPDYKIYVDLQKEMKDYEDAAVKTYTPMAEGDNNDNLVKQAGAVASQKTAIQEKLEKLDLMTSNQLLEKLKSISAYLSEKKRFNQNLFVVLLFIGILLVHFILKNHVTVPLKEIAGAAREMELGNFGVQISYAANDEMGTLADAFRSMAVSQQKKAELAATIAGGDLTSDVKLVSDKDQLGKALAEMNSSLNRILHNINDTSGQVASMANQMSSASTAVSDGAMQTASSLEEISSSIIHIESQTKTTAENAVIANQLAENARKTAEQGNQHMQELVTSIAGIQESSKQVVKIVKVIDDIAFQTNLLALNAAVEAARAGRHGKGFAVVADEVRNLANRSAKAAQETATMIGDTGSRVESGANIAGKTSVYLKEIVGTAVKMVDLSTEISTASKEQASSIAQIVQGLNQIDSITQNNASNAEQSSAIAEELSGQSAELKQQLSRFQLKG